MLDDRTSHERRLATLVLKLGRVYRREVDRALARHGLSDARAVPVLYIARLGDGVRQGILAEEMGVEGPSLVRQLDHLCVANLVERRSDPHDGRAKTLHLTDEGRALAAVVEDAVQEVRERLLAGISDADLAVTLRTLTLFEDALEGSPPPAN
jgi:MarR family transcriptional regulator for hemolysin